MELQSNQQRIRHFWNWGIFGTERRVDGLGERVEASDDGSDDRSRGLSAGMSRGLECGMARVKA